MYRFHIQHQAELGLVEFLVDAAQSQEFFMRSLLCDHTVIYHQNFVSLEYYGLQVQGVWKMC